MEKNKDMTGKKSTGKNLEQVIQKSMDRVAAKHATELCHYLPGEKGEGYMHHFTFGRMQRQNPQELVALLETYIVAVNAPAKRAPKKRASRARGLSQQLQLPRNAISHLLELAQRAGDKKAISMLLPKNALKDVKRRLIRSIRNGELDFALWESYVEAIKAEQGVLAEKEMKTLSTSVSA